MFFQRMQNCMMLDGRTDHMFYSKITDGTRDGHVVGLRAPAGKKDFRRGNVEKPGYCLPRLFNYIARFTTEGMNGRWIAEVLFHDGQHGCKNFFVQGCGGGIVE